MSTSAIVAQSDLLKQVASCSYTPTSPVNPDALDIYSWSKIFENVASSIPLRKALEFKTLHSEAYNAVNRAFRKVRKLKIQILEDKIDAKKISYIVQDSTTKNGKTAVEMVRYVLANLKCLKHLEIYFEDHNIQILNDILDEVVKSENVKLEILQVRRRHGGQAVLKIGDIIRSNASTLREISRIGISEASYGFTDKVSLDRFGCMSFDLAFLTNQIPYHMIKISESGAKFKSFSFTSISGFDPREQVVQNMIERAETANMKLTMMNPPRLNHRQGFMVSKVRCVKKIEIVEIVPEPQRINKLCMCRHVFEEVFPSASDNLIFLQQWN